MAHEYTTWAYAQDIHGAGRKFVLVALADTANADGYSYPGQKRLAQQTGQSERSVREHVDWLEENGYIKRAERRRSDGSRTSDAYYLPQKASTGEICRWEPTGKSLQTNRQISPDSPAESAGHEPSVEPPGEPSDPPPSPPTNGQADEPNGHADEDTFNPTALKRLQEGDLDTFKRFEQRANALRWQFRHKTLAAMHALRDPPGTLAAMDATIEGADATGAKAYRYFKAVLAGGGPKPNGQAPHSDPLELLRKYHGVTGTKDGVPFEVIAAGPDGRTLMTDRAGYLTPDQVEACRAN